MIIKVKHYFLQKRYFCIMTVSVHLGKSILKIILKYLAASDFWLYYFIEFMKNNKLSPSLFLFDLGYNMRINRFYQMAGGLTGVPKIYFLY